MASTLNMTQGDPVRLLVAFSIPLLIGNVFQQCYNLADMMVVGNCLGVNAVAAVGAIGPVMFLVFGGFFGLTGGLTVITAQRFGAGDADGVRRSIATSLYITLALTAFFTAACLLTAELSLRALDTPAEIFADACSYLWVMYAGTIGGVFYCLISNVLRALGDSRTPLLFLIVATFINIGLDLFFILCLGSGVAGVAWATVISQALSGALCLAYSYPRCSYLHLHGGDWRLDWRAVGRHLWVAVPMALQFSVTALGVVVLQKEINGLGTSAVAAFTAASKLDSFLIMPLFSIGMAMVTYAAQNYGARYYDRILLGERQCVRVVIVACVLASVFVAACGKWMMPLFLGTEADDEVLRLADVFLYTQAIFYPLLGLIFVYRNILQGVGQSFVTLLGGGVELVMRVVAAWALVPLIGFLGACLASPLAWFGVDVPLILTYLIVMRRLLPGKRNAGVAPSGTAA
ncbi:MAG: MATE family efflux transporter [Planctomycetes bacterium]|nr:MATE family efflux transporter [Planctomycetota bacterium]